MIRSIFAAFLFLVLVVSQSQSQEFGGTVLCVASPDAQNNTYTWERENVNRPSSVTGTTWIERNSCAPNELQVTPLGHVWASQRGTNYYFPGDGDDCTGNGWIPLPMPAGVTAVDICGSDNAAMTVSSVGGLYMRTGISPTNASGSSWMKVNVQGINGVVTHCQMSAKGTAFIVTSTNELFQSSGPTYSTWSNEGGKAAIAFTGNDIGQAAYVSQEGLVFTRKQVGGSWDQSFTQTAVDVSLDSFGTLWVVGKDGSVYAGPINGSLQTISTSNGPKCAHISASMGKPPPPVEVSVLPKPASVTYSPGFAQSTVILDSSFAITATGAASDVLSAAIVRYTALISKKLKRTTPSQAFTAMYGSSVCSKIMINVKDPNASPNISLQSDESYNLAVTASPALSTGSNTSCSVVITSPTAWGALRGLETLSQMVTLNGTFLTLPAVTISDAPRFAYRGLMIDPARRFLPLSAIFAVVDSMSYAKLNVLHIHMTDDQSWPMVMDTFPDLASKGAFAPDHTYNTSDVVKIVEYSRLRGVRVIVEVDMPGHSAILALSKPDVMTYCPGTAPYGLPYGTIDISSSNTYNYIQALFKELFTRVPDEYTFLGGDEVNTGCWSANATVMAWAKQQNLTASQLQAYFEKQVVGITRNLGKQVIVWQEVFQTATDPVGTLGKEAVVDIWKGFDKATLQSVTKAGLRAIVSGCWYLDIISGETAWGRQWVDYYNCDPTDFDGTDEQKELVMGGHACIWGEACDATNILPRIWPRLAATAERLWSPKNITTDLQDIGKRIHEFRCKLLERGVGASPVGTLGDPGVPDNLQIGPGSRTYCPDDINFAYSPPY
eukprot:m.145292 g.145292  ORF g.145292 m.145292 type:complete len:835 (+) comp14943_c1_seq1:283-2787(+)